MEANGPAEVICDEEQEELPEYDDGDEDEQALREASGGEEADDVYTTWSRDQWGNYHARRRFKNPQKKPKIEQHEHPEADEPNQFEREQQAKYQRLKAEVIEKSNKGCDEP